MSDYFELLKDPRWQKRRLEVMQRAGFACEECGAAERTLHVHHRYYIKGRKPWEYEDEALACLCEDCHASITALLAELARAAGMLGVSELSACLGYVRAQKAILCGPAEISVENAEQCIGTCDAFNIVGYDAHSRVFDLATGGARVAIRDLMRIGAEHARRVRESADAGAVAL